MKALLGGAAVASIIFVLLTRREASALRDGIRTAVKDGYLA